MRLRHCGSCIREIFAELQAKASPEIFAPQAGTVGEPFDGVDHSGRRIAAYVEIHKVASHSRPHPKRPYVAAFEEMEDEQPAVRVPVVSGGLHHPYTHLRHAVSREVATVKPIDWPRQGETVCTCSVYIQPQGEERVGLLCKPDAPCSVLIGVFNGGVITGACLQHKPDQCNSRHEYRFHAANV